MSGHESRRVDFAKKVGKTLLICVLREPAVSADWQTTACSERFGSYSGVSECDENRSCRDIRKLAARGSRHTNMDLSSRNI